RSTLSPYTTLFRSLQTAGGVQEVVREAPGGGVGDLPGTGGGAGGLLGGVGGESGVGGGGHGVPFLCGVVDRPRDGQGQEDGQQGPQGAEDHAGAVRQGAYSRSPGVGLGGGRQEKVREAYHLHGPNSTVRYGSRLLAAPRLPGLGQRLARHPLRGSELLDDPLPAREVS